MHQHDEEATVPTVPPRIPELSGTHAIPAPGTSATDEVFSSDVKDDWDASSDESEPDASPASIRMSGSHVSVRDSHQLNPQ